MAVHVQGNEMAVVCDNKTIVQPVVSPTVIYLLAKYGEALLSR
jgi:NADH pyrophosphatase NudC (nudix superfamily)